MYNVHTFHRSTGENDFGLIETLGSMEDTICLINKDIGTIISSFKDTYKNI